MLQIYKKHRDIDSQNHKIYYQNHKLSLLTQLAAFALTEFSAEPFFHEVVQAVA